MIHQEKKTTLAVLLLFATSIVLVVSLSEASDKRNNKGFEADCLRAHNKWRRLHQAPELVIDRKIAAFAQKRADHIAKSDGDEFKHPADLPFGENLAWHSRSTKSCSDLIKMWYDEVELYDFKRAQFSHETGHFTQLVWRNTERVGCAKAISSGPRGGVYLVCNYDPPGNFLGEATENVLKRASPGRATTTPTVATPTTSIPSSTSTSTTPTPIPTTTVAPTTRSPLAELEGSSASTSKKPNKKKSNGKRKNKNKKNRKGNKNKNKKRRNNKKQKLESSTTTTPQSATTATTFVNTTIVPSQPASR